MFNGRYIFLDSLLVCVFLRSLMWIVITLVDIAFALQSYYFGRNNIHDIKLP